MTTLSSTVSDSTTMLRRNLKHALRYPSLTLIVAGMLLQAAAHFARAVGPVLYASGEESEHQIKARGERLGVERAPLYILAETCLERILEEIFGTRDRTAIPSVEITDEDWVRIRQLRADKYGNRAWNYGENPKCNVQRTQRFPAGEIDARIDVQQERIAQIRFFGDYMGRLDVATLESMLAGVAYDAASIHAALSAVRVQDYFGDVSQADVVELIAP